MIVALVGNPNSGKTTLFNALTGSSQRVGNWPGVTVERKEADFEIGTLRATLVDLPGIYALAPASLEEKIAHDFIAEGAPDVILNIADATNLARNLYLTLQLTERGIPLVVAVNLTDELKARGGAVDCAKLSRALGLPVVPISAKRREGFDALFAALHAQAAHPARPRPSSHGADEGSDLPRAASLRYAAIERALAEADYRAPNDAATRATDRIVLNRALAVPLFLLVMALMFLLTFGPVGSALASLAEALIDILRGGLSLALSGAPPWFQSLILDGIVAGVGGVATFLPQILLLFLCLTVLEDSGYMARAAFIADRPLRALGLSGRSFIPLLMGYGCTTTAVIGARAVENERDRRMTILLTPFMSCGAKLPIYALIAAAVFPQNAALVLLALYALGALMMAACGALLRKTVCAGGETAFVMELPPYRLPALGNVAKRMRQRAWDFLRRAGTLIFAMSVVTWFLQSFTPGLRYTSLPGASLFALLGSWAAPLLRPLGFGDWRRAVALLSGLIAKEGVVSTLQVLYAAEGARSLAMALRADFTNLSAASFLAFTLLYTPCLPALATVARETGSRRDTATAALLPLAFAYAASLLVYQVGGALGL